MIYIILRPLKSARSSTVSRSPDWQSAFRVNLASSEQAISCRAKGCSDTAGCNTSHPSMHWQCSSTFDAIALLSSLVQKKAIKIGSLEQLSKQWRWMSNDACGICSPNNPPNIPSRPKKICFQMMIGARLIEERTSAADLH